MARGPTSLDRAWRITCERHAATYGAGRACSRPQLPPLLLSCRTRLLSSAAVSPVSLLPTRCSSAVPAFCYSISRGKYYYTRVSSILICTDLWVGTRPRPPLASTERAQQPNKSSVFPTRPRSFLRTRSDRYAIHSKPWLLLTFS